MENIFNIHAIGCNTLHPNGIYIDRPNGFDNYLFLYIKSKCNFFNGENFIEITEPSFVLYNQFTPQKYYSEEGPYVDDWMHFTGPNCSEFFADLNIPFDTPMVIINAKDISLMLNDIYTEYHQSGPHHKNIIDLKLRTLFYKFSDIYNIESTFSDKLNRYRHDFNDIRNRIYNYGSFDKNMSVGDIAASLNLSTSYFQHVYKQLFNVSVMNDIIKSRIDFACYLLQNNYDSITDIAFRCGYENKEHFTRQFKSITGYTPKQFRNKESITD